MVEELPAPRSLAVAIIPLGIVVVICNVLFLALFHFMDRLPYIVRASETAFVLAEGGLVAIWIGFGNRPEWHCRLSRKSFGCGAGFAAAMTERGQ